MPQTLSKSERLYGKTAIADLLKKGRWGSVPGFRYCYLTDDTVQRDNRILISVPKRLFKRAVKRNLLKRRIREAYRTQKDLLEISGTDILFQYNNNDILTFSEIKDAVAAVLSMMKK